MTLVIAVAGPTFFGMVSDRLVTLSSRGKYAGEHDSLANKNVVLQTRDAIAVLGYSGSAYVRGVSTDQWLAEMISGTTVGDNYSVSGHSTANRRGIGRAMWHLREALRATPEAHSVSVAVSGFRVRKGSEISFALRFGTRELVRQQQLSMRPRPRGSNFQLTWVGRGLTPTAIDEAMRPYQRLGGLLISPDETLSVLRSLVHRVAARDPTVGSDLMEVLLDRGGRRQVVCSFNPQDPHRRELSSMLPAWQRHMPPIMTPWVLAIDRMYPPLVLGGSGGPTYNLGWVEVVVEGPVGTDPSGGMSIQPMRRPPPPC